MELTDLTPIACAVLALVIAAVTTFLIPYIKRKTTKEQYTEIMSWVQIAVMAAEMIYRGVGRGEEKKQYVLDFLKGKGFKLNTEELDVMIEAAVQDLKRTKGEMS